MGRRPRSFAKRSAANRPRSPPRDDCKTNAATLSFANPSEALLRHTESRNPYTYRGPNAGANTSQRLHQEFKSLPKEERQRLVEEEAAVTDLLARTVHLRFLPTGMLQSELAALCEECGEFLRVRICGNSTNTQNWIYGFVEFAERRGAEELMRRNGKELSNGPGKPPLRLKCNAAKQAIVDRVFHDADPATNNPCIFGAGNFAHRTLKEAVDSYHNLKKKEGSMVAGKNPNALKFIPNTPASVASEGISRANNDGDAPLYTLSQHYSDPIGYELQGLLAASASACHGVHSFPTADDPSAAVSEEESPGTTPPMHFSITNGVHVPSSDAGTPSPYTLVSASDAAPCDWRLFPTPVTLPHATTMFPSSSALLAPESHFFARARALVVSAMFSAQSYVVTQQHFYDAVGALSTLLSVLDQYAGTTGGPENAVTATEDAEVPQRVTQLRLLVHLLLSILYGIKGHTEDALGAIHAIVRYCNSIPSARLPATVPSSLKESVLVAEHLGDPFSSVGDNTERKVVTVPAGEDRSAREEEMCNPLSQGMDLLSEINTGENDTEDPYTSVINAALSILPLDDFEDSLDDSKRQLFLFRDTQFHSYVVNVLLTVGLCMESLHPVVSRCVYRLASQRAKDVLGATLPELEQALVDADAHHLCSTLFPNVSAVNNRFAFAKVFFDTYTVGSPETFWNNLPPIHMVNCFPQSKNSKISKDL